MKVLFMTNVPSPYRVDFFNELGKSCDLTVTFEKKSSDERGKAWDGYKFKNFKGIFLKGKSINTDTAVCPEIMKYVKDRSYDHIICHNFSSPTGIIAIEYMKIHHIPYWIEADGSFAKDGKGFRERIKKNIFPGAKGYFSSAKECDKYYMSYGVKKKLIHRYPFTSLSRKDLLSTVATERYLEYQEKHGLRNVHFCGYKAKTELKKYYLAADLFVHPTREDIWGLVVNEAMACGLPVVTTERCIAGTELLDSDYIVPTDNSGALSAKLQEVLSSDMDTIGYENLKTIAEYTIESMTQTHLKIFGGHELSNVSIFIAAYSYKFIEELNAVGASCVGGGAAA